MKILILLWNDTGTDYYRYDHIYFLSGNGNLLEYSFGVRNNVLESGFNTSNGGEVSPFVPVHNDIYRADVFLMEYPKPEVEFTALKSIQLFPVGVVPEGRPVKL